MQNTLSPESQKSLTNLMIIWFTMVGALFVYLFVCYLVLIQEKFKAPYTLDILQTNLFMSIEANTAIYIAAALIFIVGDFNFKTSYRKLIFDVARQTFENKDEEFKYFRTKYTTMMFIHLAIFDAIAILGVIIFFLTLDFTTLVNLVIISLFGFVVVMPSKSKFQYRTK